MTCNLSCVDPGPFPKPIHNTQAPQTMQRTTSRYAYSILLTLLLSALTGIAAARSADTTGGKVISQKKFERLMKKKNTVVLDVRTPGEYRDGHIPGALLIDVLQPEAFKAKAAELDRTNRYLVYCKSGRRSHQATVILRQMGFQDLYDLAGGFSAWTGTKEP